MNLPSDAEGPATNEDELGEMRAANKTVSVLLGETVRATDG